MRKTGIQRPTPAPNSDGAFFTLTRYRTFIVRAWQAQDPESDHGALWRYSVKAADAPEWQHLANLDELLAHLRDEFDASGVQAVPEDKTP